MTATEEKEEEIKLALESLSSDPKEPRLQNAVQRLAAASRKSESIRQQLADPTILKNLTSLLASDNSDSTTTDPALRCIANACANNDDARNIICSEDIGFAWARKCLQSPEDNVRLLTTKVQNNICCDHEASQRLCYKENIHHDLIRFLDSEMVRNMSTECKLAGDLDSAIDVLFWVSGQKAETETTEALPDDVLEGLLDLHSIWTNDWDIETFATLSETTLVFLRDGNIQSQIISRHLFEKVWTLLEKQEDLIIDPSTSEEDQKLLKPLQASLVWCLSDLSANQAFASTYFLQSPEICAIESIIISAGRFTKTVEENTLASSQTLNAASQVLGNLLWTQKSPEDYSSLIFEKELHQTVFHIVMQPSPSPDILHSSAGLLIQLCRASTDVREKIGGYEPYARESIERLCRHQRPEIKQGGVQLVKALGKDCPENQRRFAELAGEAMGALQQQSAASEQE